MAAPPLPQPSLYHLMFFPLLLVVSVESRYKVEQERKRKNKQVVNMAAYHAQPTQPLPSHFLLIDVGGEIERQGLG